jgi:thioredoxin
MPRVFVSHSTQDRALVESEIIPLLKRHGVETWYSRDSIVPADQWERSILQGLKACDCFLLVMSPRSASSPWVKREVDWVFNKGGRTIVPVLLKDCDPDDFHIGLAGLQHVDFSTDREAGRRQLLQVWGIEYSGEKAGPPKVEPPARRGGQQTNRLELDRVEVLKAAREQEPPRAQNPPSSSSNDAGGKLALEPIPDDLLAELASSSNDAGGKLAFVELSADAFEREVLESPIPVLVEFWARWCGPCRQFTPVVRSVAEQFAGRLKLVMVNTDEHPKVAEQCGVSAIPHLALFTGGDQPAARKVGIMPDKELRHFIETGLQSRRG